MYALNYIPGFIGFLVIIFIFLRRQISNETVLWWVMTIFGIGIIISYLQMEIFVNTLLEVGDRISTVNLISALRVLWMSTWVAFITCIIVIGVKVYVNIYYSKTKS